jgi:hypothetical protein
VGLETPLEQLGVLRPPGVRLRGEDLGVEISVFVDAPCGLVAVDVVQLNGDARQRSLLLDMDLTGPVLGETRSYRLALMGPTSGSRR